MSLNNFERAAQALKRAGRTERPSQPFPDEIEYPKTTLADIVVLVGIGTVIAIVIAIKIYA
jgi:hypothetical protein